MSEDRYDQSAYATQQEEDDERQGSSGGKRKRDDNSGTQRAKRNRYISIACNECKRRKIKCNGEVPCQRCGNLKLECVYEPNCCSGNLKHSSDFKQLTAHIAHLEGQIQYLLQNLNQLRSSIGQDDFPDVAQYLQSQPAQQNDGLSSMGVPQANMAIDPALQSRTSKTSPQQPRLQGSSRSSFSLGVAQHSLKHMGMSSAEEAIDAGILSQIGTQESGSAAKRSFHPTKDPIWGVSKDEALRLCRVFEDENGILYPFLDMDHLIRHGAMLYQFMEAAQKSFFVNAFPGADTLQDEDTDALKLVLAIALSTEGGGESDMGKRLFDQVNKTSDTRLLGRVNLKDIQILTLTAIYHFHTDDEGLAWRVIGLTARLCLELGLHRAETYTKVFEDERERNSAMKTFWSVYVLDFRWSMGTGMSFALQDAEIDKNIPTPEETSPYLATMIRYARIGRKVWKSVFSTESAQFPGNTFSKEEARYLNYQIMEWYSSIPQQLRFAHPEDPGHTSQAADNMNQSGGRGVYRLKALLYLRYNHIRLTTYRPTLHSAKSIAANSSAAQTAVEVAKDTIRVLKHIDQGSNLYRTQQTTWNHFLVAALAALALAHCHAPELFSEICREEFLTALDLIRGLSGNSYVSKRLWRTIRSLRELGPSLGYTGRSGQNNNNSNSNNNGHNTGDTGSGDLGLQHHMQQGRPQNDAQRSAAAMAMAGLATGQPVDESAFFASHAQGSTDLNSNITRNDQAGHLFTNPNGMATELTSLFEAAGVLGGAGGGNGNWSNGFGGDVGQNSNGNNGGGDQGQAYAGIGGSDGRLWPNDNEELGRILRELY